jgi:hypothetical protein
MFDNQNQRASQQERIYLVVIEKTDNEQKKRKLNPFDAGLIVIIMLGLLGFRLAKSSHAGVNSAITESGSLSIDVAFTGIKTLDTDMFKVGSPVSITIRNVPTQPPMRISKVQHTPKQVTFLAPDGKKAIAFPDPANPNAHDFLVTVQEDHAEKTNDGWVIHGVKIKVGNPIELEAAKYRVAGVIADVHKTSQSDANAAADKTSPEAVKKQ